MILSCFTLRGIVLSGALALAVVASATPGFAQALADKLATNAGHAFVNKINGESCSQFAATMAQMKGGGSSSSGMSSRLKSNPQARTDFVNIVAAPLLNKMIDCNMVPGGK